MDKDDKYKKLTQSIVQRRYKALWEGLGISMMQDPLRAGYYCEVDMMVWAEVNYGKDFAKYLEANYEPVDILFRLAEQTSIVLMDGGGFAGPRWSVRVSLANLDDTAYGKIGKQMAEAAEVYVEAWQNAKGSRGKSKGKSRTH